MARLRRTSSVLTEAETLHSGLLSIQPPLDFGDGISIATQKEQMEGLRTLLKQYNGTLADADAQLNELEKAEATLNTLSLKLRKAVEVRYGNDSNEYEMAGGKRASERKRPGRRADKRPSLPVSA